MTRQPEYNSLTTLRRIRGSDPCEGGWRNLLTRLGKTRADDEPLPLLTVLDSNGLDDAFWVLSNAMLDDRLARHLQARITERVLHLYECEYPDDLRIRDQIAMLRNDDASPKERAAARDAARAAAWDAERAAAWDAERAAAKDAAWAAERAAAKDAAWAAWAAWDAARAAAKDAAKDAARAAAWAAWDAARAAGAAWAARAKERKTQEHILREMIAQEVEQ